jgi:putative pyruvate formate lyase activating enzyme
MDCLDWSNCCICPRECGVNRSSGERGFCNAGTSFEIASVCIHQGEEPVISGEKGICNVFFKRCNLQCIYCQNDQISRNTLSVNDPELSLDEVISQIIPILDSGIKLLGFVSPGHCVLQMMSIIKALREKGYHPRIVYNSNGYDNIETLKLLENYVDIYLPDFKYSDDDIALEYSQVVDYRAKATASLKEMYRQKGTLLLKSDEGQAESGLIVRHLVLPGHIENSINVLRILADIFPVSLHISLMSQYYPTAKVRNHPVLGRTLTYSEYDQVVEELHNIGFYKGWVQGLHSAANYQPDFEQKHPFETE